MKSGRTVWLVGMMGAGKSTVGRVLARRLGRPFADSDAEIERDAGRSVVQIFALEGQEAFRALEREAVGALLGMEAVVALGGGAVAQPGLRQKLQDSGVLVYLRATPETLLSRVAGGEERPLLEGLDEEARLERLRTLLAEREPAYSQAAVCVDTDGRRVPEVVDEVARALEELDIATLPSVSHRSRSRA